MILLKTNQDNHICCTPSQLLPSDYINTTQFVLNIHNKIFNYTFTLNDTSSYTARYNTLYLPQSDLNGVNEGDYTYTITIAALPALILDTGRLRIYTTPVAPVVYNNVTEQNNAYIN